MLDIFALIVICAMVVFVALALVQMWRSNTEVAGMVVFGSFSLALVALMVAQWMTA